MQSLVDIAGLRLLVVGANSGIGLAAAELAIAAGADVAVTLMPGSERPATLPADVPAFFCDVTSAVAVEEGVRGAAETLGALDGVVVTAGIFEHRGILETAEDDWRRIMGINCDGAYHVARAVAPLFSAAGGGSLVLFSSQIGIVGHRRATAYAASKAAVNGLARTLSIEFAAFGARVNAVAPGPIETPMTAVARSDASRSAALVEAVPLKRFGTAEEVARAALFLAAPASSFVTGHVLVVDGGVTAI